MRREERRILKKFFSNTLQTSVRDERESARARTRWKARAFQKQVAKFHAVKLEYVAVRI